VVQAGVYLTPLAKLGLAAGLLEDELDHGVGQARVLLPGLGVVDQVVIATFGQREPGGHICSRRSAASVEQVGSVVLADGGCGAFVEGVEEADGVGLAGELADVGLVGPVEGGCLVVGGQVAAGDLAAEDQGDDAAGHVLVDAGERVGLDVESGFLADLAAQPS
jgi:hypothetical protein